jgi:hypothetical protein
VKYVRRVGRGLLLRPVRLSSRCLIYVRAVLCPNTHKQHNIRVPWSFSSSRRLEPIRPLAARRCWNLFRLHNGAKCLRQNVSLQRWSWKLRACSSSPHDWLRSWVLVGYSTVLVQLHEVLNRRWKGDWMMTRKGCERKKSLPVPTQGLLATHLHARTEETTENPQEGELFSRP